MSKFANFEISKWNFSRTIGSIFKPRTVLKSVNHIGSAEHHYAALQAFWKSSPLIGRKFLNFFFIIFFYFSIWETSVSSDFRYFISEPSNWLTWTAQSPILAKKKKSCYMFFLDSKLHVCNLHLFKCRKIDWFELGT